MNRRDALAMLAAGVRRQLWEPGEAVKVVYIGGVFGAMSSGDLGRRIEGDYAGVFGKVKAEITLDILNFLNLLNNNWGRMQFVNFNQLSVIAPITVQPTEQWVQMFLRSVTGTPGFIGPASDGLRHARIHHLANHRVVVAPFDDVGDLAAALADLAHGPHDALHDLPAVGCDVGCLFGQCAGFARVIGILRNHGRELFHA